MQLFVRTTLSDYLFRKPEISERDLELPPGSKCVEIDWNRVTFDVLNILSQLSQVKSKPTMRQLFERLDKESTGKISLL
jgi:hypothetical protein